MTRIKNITITADNTKDALNQLNEAFDEMRPKPVIITNASIKEELCNYGYEINTGPCKGDKISNRKGSALVHEDMNHAFNELDKHLAFIDDAFSFMKKSPSNIDELAKYEEIISNFNVTGFKVHGTDENEGYILLGDKYVSQGTISLETPKITKQSGYVFFDDLAEQIEACRTEVEAYMNGKATPKLEQGDLFAAAAGAEGGNEFDNPMQD